MKRPFAGLVLSLSLACGMGAEPPDRDPSETELSQSEAGLASTSLLSYTSPVDLIASTGNLYWTTYGIDEFGPDSATVYRASKSNTPGAERVLWRETGDKSAFYYFGGITYAFVNGRWYGYFIANYGQSSQLKRVPLEGGTAVVLAHLPAFVGTRDLVTDGTTLYWADAQALRSMPIGGGAITTLRPGAGFSKLALSTVHLYFTEGPYVRRILKTGGPMSTRATDGANITAMTVHQSGNIITMYWGTASGAVKSLRSGGSVITHQWPIAGRGITSVDFDGLRVLWTDCILPGNSSCTVKKRQGTTTSTVASGSVGAGKLQSDGASLYWGDVSSLKKYVH